MSVLDVEKLSFTYDGTQLLKEIDFRLFKNDHLGLVGINGSGKSTLLKILSGKLKQDAGSVIWQPGIKTGYLDQYKEIASNLTVDNYLKEVFLNLYKKEKEMEDFFVLGVTNNKYLNKACLIQEELLSQDFYQIKAEIGKIIGGLGIPLSYLDRNINSLSGGEKEKIILAKLLLEEVDVLLLDEPTNFLDVEQVEWLAKYLSNYKNAFILVSHENSFVSKVCNVICEISSYNLTRYKGDYNYYLKEREIRLDQNLKAFTNQQKHIKKTLEYIDKNIARQSTSKMAKSRRKQLEKIEVIVPPLLDKRVKFAFLQSGDSYKTAVEVKDLVLGYDKPLLDAFDLTIIKNTRIVVRGENGVGKSTFIKTILNQIKPISGEIITAKNLKIGYFSQNEEIDVNLTPITYIQEKFPKFEEKIIRNSLASVGINAKLATSKMNTLSGGEQARVRLLRLSLMPTNILILDEPTNHLDTKSKIALINALNEYHKTLIIITHENDFAKKIDARELNFTS